MAVFWSMTRMDEATDDIFWSMTSMDEIADLAAKAADLAGCWPAGCWPRPSRASRRPPPTARRVSERHDHGVIRPGTSADRWHPMGVLKISCSTSPPKVILKIMIRRGRGRGVERVFSITFDDYVSLRRFSCFFRSDDSGFLATTIPFFSQRRFRFFRSNDSVFFAAPIS